MTPNADQDPRSRCRPHQDTRQGRLGDRKTTDDSHMVVRHYQSLWNVPFMGWGSSSSVERACMAAVVFGGLVAVVGMVLLAVL